MSPVELSYGGLTSAGVSTKELNTPIQEKPNHLDGYPTPHKSKLALSWNKLSVRGVGSTQEVLFHPDMGSYFAPWTLINAKKKAARLAADQAEAEGGAIRNGMVWEKGMGTPKKGQPGLRPGQRYLIKDFSGVLHPGEMMLVVGRPGSGCSTFLKSLAGLTRSYAGVDGEIRYGDVRYNSKEFRPYASLVCYSAEEDNHDPSLTVGRTMDFVTRNELVSERTRQHLGQSLADEEYRIQTKNELLDTFGISHTHDTKVGNQYIRGVSGGERKRVSLAEALATNASIHCWDNATRGLDASTALDYTRLCRRVSDQEGKINVVSAYQAGNGIYNLFDKVTVIAEGHLLYYGRRTEAQPYFEALGFQYIDGSNVADYLTTVTSPTERLIIPGYEDTIPSTAIEIAAIYANSDVARKMAAELAAHRENDYTNAQNTHDTFDAVRRSKRKGAIKRWPFMTSFPSQIKAALIREYQQRWGDQFSFWGRYVSSLTLALITGSVFYDMPLDTSGLFLRGGSVFSALILPVILTFADVQIASDGRPVLAKQKGYSMYRPAALFLAQTLADLPLNFVQLAIHSVILYFMGGYQKDAGLFFAFLLFSFTMLGSMTALFRSVGYMVRKYNDATKITGFIFIAFTIYSGYIIYPPDMHPWFSWIRWVNPFYYLLEAALVDELDGLTFACAPPSLAPFGQGYEAGPAACAIIGAAPGTTFVTGRAYLESALGFSKSHVWRNWGFAMAWWGAYVVLGCLVVEWVPAAGDTKTVVRFKRGGGPGNEEKENDASNFEGITEEGSGTTFTWKDLDYTVKSHGIDLQLLDKVSGYCKSGTLTALMGASGAGKTTLMDVLAARKDEGVIQGDVLLNGQSLPLSFQRTTGYCEQLDVHLPTATVREALEFSALLRQPRRFSRGEKLAYVEVIIDLLELRDYCDAIVGIPGTGLGMELRKRLTIGVELVSRPSLLFLDEPTSGLDGQSSYMILQFLRKLAKHGQSILCTVHQPSSALFAEFDQLLLMKRGGQTVYFGAVEKMPQYFGEHGCDFPRDTNPAEYMIDVVSCPIEDRNWAEVWNHSKQRDAMMQELETINDNARQVPQHLDEYEYAASFWTQMVLVVHRASIQLYRDTEYILNKILLHISVALLIGFSYYKIGDSKADLQNRMFAVFLFVFVAPGAMVQTQPKFIANRDIFEKREKKSKFYSWWVFCLGEILSELPWLVLCAVIFWCCWYPTSGFDLSPEAAGPVVITMFLYELLYTGMAQSIAAYAPDPPAAALFIPVLIANLVTFSGVMVPYAQLTAFWRYWMYYLDPFRYLLGALMNFTIWDVGVTCNEDEYGVFDPPSGMTCGEYMSPFLAQAKGYMVDPNATQNCGYCEYRNGREYLNLLNITSHGHAYRDMGVTLLFCVAWYGLVFVLLKLRSKRSKTASQIAGSG